MSRLTPWVKAASISSMRRMERVGNSPSSALKDVSFRPGLDSDTT